ncbi:hypothetical protein W97_04522 [Coniosporium apollinis CBS 100218]|uniref:Sialidase n=1 Tax=Coniosporium apollinis (strain CBS 100218) TaxID=1168221 RepID=R7YTZ3_CONA1|nr:uncharacterized protein W97_04522 [Coniosporium apollinis CBS 100218]EON65284.1 hypothetical protein W97_04522 [Coniosporium apollinis CBS 100218]
MDVMYRRHITPPTANQGYHLDGIYSGSVSDGSFYSQNTSPESAITNITTPPRSPIRQHGPLLLPKIRSQDQTTEPVSGPVRHRRTVSTASTEFSAHFTPYPQRTSLLRRSTSPPNHSTLVSPVSAPSPYDAAFHSALNSPIDFASSVPKRPSLAQARSHSTSAIRTHSRSGSASSVDESVIGRYGFPTYRKMPTYITASSLASCQTTYATASPASCCPPEQPWQLQIPQVQQPAQLSLPTELQYETFTQPPETTSLMSYLTASNPSPALVRRVTTVGRGVNTHFWWDVRNLRSWTDFNMSTISSIPGLLPLLNIPVPTPALTEPARPNLQPDSESALHDVWRDHLAVKVNAALKVAQGNTHMAMRAIKPQPHARQQPEFVSNYQSDYEKTIFGDGRGRVVGLVKAYDQWNTGMRSEAPNKQVYYLQGLAHLHRVMREHGCRYGFILTEIELLCVRCGGPSGSGAVHDVTTVNADSSVPLFGYLELAAPIRLSTHGMQPQTSESQMTAGLALWYLHMLAKESPLPGMGSWRMDVGGPAALSRQNVLEKDDWIPKPNLGEKREAKRVRGWVWPEEPLSRKECGRGKRVRKA